MRIEVKAAIMEGPLTFIPAYVETISATLSLFKFVPPGRIGTKYVKHQAMLVRLLFFIAIGIAGIRAEEGAEQAAH